MLVRGGPKFDGSAANGIPGRHIDRNFDVRESKLNEIYCWHEIRISTNYDQMVGKFLVCIIQHGNGDIYIGPLLFLSVEKSTAAIDRTAVDETSDSFILVTSKNDAD